MKLLNRVPKKESYKQLTLHNSDKCDSIREISFRKCVLCWKLNVALMKQMCRLRI